MAAMAACNWALYSFPSSPAAASLGGQPQSSYVSRPFSSLSSCTAICGLRRLHGVRRMPCSSPAVQRGIEWMALEGKKNLRSRILAAQEAAAQAEAAEDQEEKEDFEEAEDGAGAKPGSSLEPLLEELKAALAANDEKHVAKMEAQLGAMEVDRDSLAKQVTGLIEEVQTGKERLLRLSADFANFRKRSENEKANLTSSVRGDVIESLLPMVDNFERAKSSIRTETEGEEKIDRAYQGIYKQFVEIMKGLGVVAVETVGKAFDPNLHEAIMREEHPEYEEGIIVQEFRRGFSIGNKLVRPAMVKVSAGPGASKGEAGQVEEAAEVVQEAAGDDTK